MAYFVDGVFCGWRLLWMAYFVDGVFCGWRILWMAYFLVLTDSVAAVFVSRE